MGVIWGLGEKSRENKVLEEIGSLVYQLCKGANSFGKECLPPLTAWQVRVKLLPSPNPHIINLVITIFIHIYSNTPSVYHLSWTLFAHLSLWLAWLLVIFFLKHQTCWFTKETFFIDSFCQFIVILPVFLIDLIVKVQFTLSVIRFFTSQLFFNPFFSWFVIILYCTFLWCYVSISWFQIYLSLSSHSILSRVWDFIFEPILRDYWNLSLRSYSLYKHTKQSEKKL